MNYVSVIFCRRCGSRFVEVGEWSEAGTAVIQCRSCNNREEIRGFTLGRCQVPDKELQEARETAARGGTYEH